MNIFTRALRKAVFLALCFVVSSQILSGQQVARGLTAQNGTFIGFYEYKPTDYDLNPTTRYPVIIFLHGIGERGNGTSDLPRVLANAIPRYIQNGHPMRFFWNGKWETFLVLSPQLSNNYGDWQNFYVEEMINYAKANLRIDENRIMLTGLSLGGGGVWNYTFAALANAQKLAAIAPVCGVCPSGNACNVAATNLPVWAFHAANDGTVGAGCTNGTINNINSCNPAVKPIMSIYPDGGHSIWDRSYDTEYNWHNPNIYEWFLGQNKSLPPNVLPVANAGADQSTLLGGAVTLNGTGSYDTDGNIAKYIWRQISGPGSGSIVSINGSTTQVINLNLAGTYQYELTVADNRTGWTKDVVTVTVGSTPAPNQNPVANAGADVTINLPTNSVSLNGTASYDPNGSITNYSWTKISGPAQNNIACSGCVSTTASSLVQGTYQFRLVVTDNNGAADDDTVTVVVNGSSPSPNQNPVANAGADVTITLPTNTATLNGSGSNDADGSITNYAWSKISGPAQYNIASAGSASTTAGNLVQGTYQFRLLVTDNNGGADDDTVTIVVNGASPSPNQSPVANAGADVSITLPANSATLNGSGSNDPDGSITSFAWSKIAGPAQYNITSAASATTTATSLVQGVYQFRLVTTDNNGAADADTVTITVNGPSGPSEPIANAGADITITLPANSTTLNGSGVDQDGGFITAYSWTKISGPTSYTIASPSSASTSITNLVQGVYQFRLLVTDNGTLQDADTVAVIVNPAVPAPNQRPVANAGADVSITLPTSTATLNGAGSADPDGTIATFSWVKISGPSIYNITNAGASTTTATSLQQGTYRFRLIVTDNAGATDDDTVSINVIPAPNLLPVANAGADLQVTLPQNSTTLNASASSDPDGTIASYSWTKISGPAVYNISNANAMSTSVTSLQQGTYLFRLLITDNSGATDADTVAVNVNSAPPPPNQAPVANAGSDQSITLPTNSVTLNGSASYDPDGNIANYNWNKVSGPASYNFANAGVASPTISNLTAGTYQFRLVVTDNNGATSEDLVNVIVVQAPPAANQAPVAHAGADLIVNLPISDVQLNGSTSYDPDGSIASFSWVKINGAGGVTLVNSTSANPTISGLQAGSYTIELTVTDDKGATAKDQLTIVVIAAPNQAPVARAGNDIALTDPSAQVSLNAGLSTDLDGTIQSFQWRQISGPTSASLTNINQVIATASGFQIGSYQFELVVTDNNGAIGKDTIGVLIINTLRDEERITAYPNPATTQINFVCVSDKTGNAKMNIYDANGKLVKTQMFEKVYSSQQLNVNITDLKAGLYIAEFNIDNKKRMIIKFVKQ